MQMIIMEKKLMWKHYKELTALEKRADKMQISMVGFVLKNTLSENGGVTRGVCKVDDNQMLTEIVETSNIVKTADMVLP